jgi:hypothetical protein
VNPFPKELSSDGFLAFSEMRDDRNAYEKLKGVKQSFDIVRPYLRAGEKSLSFCKSFGKEIIEF